MHIGKHIFTAQRTVIVGIIAYVYYVYTKLRAHVMFHKWQLLRKFTNQWRANAMGPRSLHAYVRGNSDI